MFNITCLILFIPLVNYLVLSFFGQFVGLKGSSILSFVNSLLLLLVSYLSFFKFTLDHISYFFNFGTWIKSGFLLIKFEFMFDSLSLSMLVLVSSISTIVHWYSLEYMYKDPYIIKFLSYLSLFTLFMILLITASDLGLLLIGWEGVGICSFLLISFWNSRLSASKAAIKAIIFNRFGDLGFFIGLALIVSTVQSLNLHVVFQTLPYFKDFYINLITLGDLVVIKISVIDFILFFMCFGVIGKSAQIGLHVWLLDAMEGPTPVSALIHAATMVTAGVFILLRMSFILEFSQHIQTYISIIGAVTAVTAAAIAIFQTDIKSIIAYSTCSQLGYMVLSCGISSYSVSFFHLFNHGFFKALLFLSSGVIIHNFMEEQDIRKMGGLFYSFPLTYTLFVVGSAALVGVPFLSGFFSKDLIIESLNSAPFLWTNFIYRCSLIAAFFSSLYSFKLIYTVFLHTPNASSSRYNSSELFTIPMLIGLFFLLLGSIFSGVLFFNFFVPVYNTFFMDAIFSKSYLNCSLTFVEFYHLSAPDKVFLANKMFPIYILIMSFFLYSFSIVKSGGINKMLNSKWYLYAFSFFSNGLHFNFIYIYFLLNWGFKIAWNFFMLDKALIENTVYSLIVSPIHKMSIFNNFLVKNRTSFEFIFIFTYFILIWSIIYLI